MTNLLFWNIEKFGPSKFEKPEILEAIARVFVQQGGPPDIWAIVELTKNTGMDALKALLKEIDRQWGERRASMGKSHAGSHYKIFFAPAGNGSAEGYGCVVRVAETGFYIEELAMDVIKPTSLPRPGGNHEIPWWGKRGVGYLSNLSVNGKTIDLFLYHAPATNSQTKDNLAALLNEAVARSDPSRMLVAGDFNISGTGVKVSSPNQLFVQELEQTFLIYPDERVETLKNPGWGRIDFFVTLDGFGVESSKVLRSREDKSLSDHKPLLLQF